jgi:hypothetical protein
VRCRGDRLAWVDVEDAGQPGALPGAVVVVWEIWQDELVLLVEPP